MADPAAVNNRHTDVVDQFLFDELLAIVDRVEDFTDRNRRRRMLANRAETMLGFSAGHRILEPEEPVAARGSGRAARLQSAVNR